MNPKLTFSISIALVALALVVVACGGNATSAPTAQPTAPSAPTAQATTAPAPQPTAVPTVAPTPAPQSFEIKYTYDGAGRLTQADYGNIVVNYTYDKAGNLLAREVVKK